MKCHVWINYIFGEKSGGKAVAKDTLNAMIVLHPVLILLNNMEAHEV